MVRMRPWGHRLEAGLPCLPRAAALVSSMGVAKHESGRSSSTPIRPHVREVLCSHHKLVDPWWASTVVLRGGRAPVESGARSAVSVATARAGDSGRCDAADMAHMLRR